MNDVVIRGANAVLEDGTRRADIGIDGERIAAIAAAGSLPKGKHEIDASDLVALPGLIDMHSHHREPGFAHKEDLAHMGRQCAVGGVTTSVAMPNVSPPPTTAKDLDGMIAGPGDGCPHATEVEAGADLLGCLVERVVEFLPVDFRHDVER